MDKEMMKTTISVIEKGEEEVEKGHTDEKEKEKDREEVWI